MDASTELIDPMTVSTVIELKINLNQKYVALRLPDI